jgi:hypothetical protein
MATVVNDPEGLHVMGLIVKLPPPPAQDPNQQPAPPPEPAPAPPPAPAGEASAPSGPLVRVDRFSWSGLDFTFTDRTTDPVTVVPITGLDVDVRNLSNRLKSEPKSVPFSIVVESETSRCPGSRRPASSAAQLQDTINVVSGKEVEDRGPGSAAAVRRGDGERQSRLLIRS